MCFFIPHAEHPQSLDIEEKFFNFQALLWLRKKYLPFSRARTSSLFHNFVIRYSSHSRLIQSSLFSLLLLANFFMSLIINNRLRWMGCGEEKNQPAFVWCRFALYTLVKETTHEFSYYWECIECDSRQNKKVKWLKSTRGSDVDENLIEIENKIKKKLALSTLWIVCSNGIEWA
jgi:hypothetical protein